MHILKQSTEQCTHLFKTQHCTIPILVQNTVRWGGGVLYLLGETARIGQHGGGHRILKTP